MLPRILFAVLCVGLCQPGIGNDQLKNECRTAMRRAADYFRSHVASHGGYVYHYSLDLSRRWGEGEATKDQIWVQPPGTPTVGLAFVRAFEATGDEYYVKAVNEVAEALMYGQLESGGWTNCIDFDPKGARVAKYRNGRGRGKNNSSLDDGQSQTAIRFIMAADKANKFMNEDISRSVKQALEALLAAQFDNGGFPQSWTGPVDSFPVRAANFPDTDYRTVERIKNYWDMPTLNDNVCVHVAQVFMDAHEIYHEPAHLEALKRLGDFLLLAQMPDPQPAWAQQYNFNMQPVWARRFEPPAISGHESQAIVGLLLDIARYTRDEKYLKPIPKALDYLERSTLRDGQIARYYELKTNHPLYMERQGDVYTPTYDDSSLPSHYSWKTKSRVADLRRQLAKFKATVKKNHDPVGVDRVRQVLGDLDSEGRWVTAANGDRLVGQAKFDAETKYISSAAFSENMAILSGYVESND
jgi:PelA/Pel-15E family pectate lyase